MEPKSQEKSFTTPMAKGKSTKRLLIEDSFPLPILPEEIITEILLKLPVKALVKFRCVSKSWLSLISTSHFINAHLEISTKNNMGHHDRLLFGPTTRPTLNFCIFPLCPNIDSENLCCMDTLAFDSPFDYGIRVVGSCNGLVCVSVGRCDFVLWNPATRKSRRLPISSKNILTRECGYAYDAFTDDYKIVEFSWIMPYHGMYRMYETQVKVYSSRSDSWRVMDWAGGEVFDGPGVFVNQAIHWKVTYDRNNTKNWVVIAQNVAAETCSILELPMVVRNGANVMLGVSGEYLCASYDHFTYMDVWVMKEHGVQESWIKMVSFPYLFCMENPSYGKPKLWFVAKDGAIIVKIGSCLVMYKPSHQCCEIHRLNDHVEAQGVTYNESLLSPYFDGC